MKIVIVGNHAAGLSAAETLRRNDKSCEIVIISNEDVAPYSRCLIPYVLSGEKSVEEIQYRDPDFYRANNVSTMLGVTVVRVLAKEKAVLLSTGQKVGYDALILANGGSPALPRLDGAEKQGVFRFRTLQDAQNIGLWCEKAQDAVILGGGLVGLKAAVALHKRGLKVRVVVGSPNVLSQIVAAHEAKAFESHLAEMGIEILVNANPAVILGEGKVQGVQTTDGKSLPAQVVIIGKGVEPNLDPLQGSEIKAAAGIMIDEHCRTNIDSVYAAGDVTQEIDFVRGKRWMNSLWPHAVEAGRVAAENILGQPSTLRHHTSMNSFVIGELAMISCGLTGAREKLDDCEEVTLRRPDNRCRRFVFREDRLVGFALVGDVAHAGVLTSLLMRGVKLGVDKDRIVSGQYDFGSMFGLMKRNRDQFVEPEFDEVFRFF